ncbi:MAG: hypothetical protein NT051_01925 [Candidatus Micrarchaeota archaeon]|nr:hypothetical protein [Candidatus Micrarchaeota archaeon]
MPSSLPSSVMRQGVREQPSYKPPEMSSHGIGEAAPMKTGGLGSLPLFIAVIAIGLSLFNVYLFYYGEKPLSPSQRVEIQGISDSLKALQNREITVTAPVQSEIYLNKSYLIRDMFPPQFEMPLEFDIPIDTQMVGISTSGQPVSFRMQESVPIKTKIMVSSEKAFGNSSIQIKKAIPIQVDMYANVKIRSAFRDDISGITDRLDKLAAGISAQ